MHPALYSRREQLSVTLVRFLAYLGGISLLSIAAAHVFQSQPSMWKAAASPPVPRRAGR